MARPVSAEWSSSRANLPGPRRPKHRAGISRYPESQETLSRKKQRKAEKLHSPTLQRRPAVRPSSRFERGRRKGHRADSSGGSVCDISRRLVAWASGPLGRPPVGLPRSRKGTLTRGQRCGRGRPRHLGIASVNLTHRADSAMALKTKLIRYNECFYRLDSQPRSL
jgi:hypothetical protein